MEESSIKQSNNNYLKQNGGLEYSNKNYNFEIVLSIPIILDQIFQFLEKENIKCLSLCSKKIYSFYCNQIKKLKIREDVDLSNILNIILYKYVNLCELDLEGCVLIEDFWIISKLEKLENLNLSKTNVSDISFIEKNKNIKKLNLEGCIHIKDYLVISKLEKLENLKN